MSWPSGVLIPISTLGSTSRKERGARNRSWVSFSVSPVWIDHLAQKRRRHPLITASIAERHASLLCFVGKRRPIVYETLNTIPDVVTETGWQSICVIRCPIAHRSGDLLCLSIVAFNFLRRQRWREFRNSQACQRDCNCRQPTVPSPAARRV